MPTPSVKEVNGSRLLTVHDLAERWRMSRSRIYEMVQSGALRALRLSGSRRRSVRFRLADVEQYERLSER